MISNSYHIDLNMTNSCNFKCSYCSESQELKKYNTVLEKRKCNNDLINNFFKFIKKLKTSDFFKRTFTDISISFWGGEPSLEIKKIEKILKKYEDDEQLSFFIFTNGYEFDDLFILLNKYKNIKTKYGKDKFLCQISYDGEPLQSKNRVHKKIGNSSENVRNSILLCRKENIPLVLKATLKTEDFKYLYDAYMDYRSLDDNRNFSYFPTIDYFNTAEDYENDFKLYFNDLKENLIKIAKMEKIQFEKTGRFLFHWFNESRKLCSAGMSLGCIDLNGKLYKCHGALYSNFKEDHLITDITADDAIDKVEQSYEFHKKIFVDTCSDCYATYCLRCNSVKYSLSNKEEYGDRWNDYKNQKILCEYYKLVSRVYLALVKSLKI